MNEPDDLVAWFTEQLDAEEAVARAAHAVDGVGEWKHNDEGGSPWRITRSDDQYGDHVVVYDMGSPYEVEARHIALWDPARVLAEVAAKRAILALHRQQGGVCLFCTYTISSESGRESAVDDAVPFCEDWPCDTVRHLAAPYADQPGYRPEWAVGS